jgi:hypothetical protein
MHNDTEFWWEKLSKKRILRRRWMGNIKMKFRDIGYEDGRWMKWAQDRVQQRTLVLALLNLHVLPPDTLK